MNDTHHGYVRCKWCTVETLNHGTKECDRCWELRTRIESNPELTFKMFKAIKENLTFNINYKVKVKLTEHGRNKYIEKLKKLFLRLNITDKEYSILKEDRDGYSSWQLWNLMEELGQYCGLCKPEPFDLDIKIPTKNLNL